MRQAETHRRFLSRRNPSDYSLATINFQTTQLIEYFVILYPELCRMVFATLTRGKIQSTLSELLNTALNLA